MGNSLYGSVDKEGAIPLTRSQNAAIQRRERVNAPEPYQHAQYYDDFSSPQPVTSDELARQKRLAEIEKEKAALKFYERELVNRIEQCDVEINAAVEQMSRVNEYFDFC